MADHRVQATFLIRNGAAATWASRNPVLLEGEFGLENDTFLIKVGDGVTDWEHLPYLNKLNARYFKQLADGSLTFSDWFATQIENLIAQQGGGSGGHLVIDYDPTVGTDPVRYSYLQTFVANAIAQAGHLKREIVQILPVSNIDENTIYMVPNSSGTGYEEYMYITNMWDKVGDTGDHSGYVLPVATTVALGGVRADDPTIQGHENTEYLSVTQEGFMTLNAVSTSKLFVPSGDTLILYGGSA